MHQQTHLRTHTHDQKTVAKTVMHAKKITTYRCGRLKRAIIKKKETNVYRLQESIRFDTTFYILTL